MQSIYCSISVIDLTNLFEVWASLFEFSCSVKCLLKAWIWWSLAWVIFPSDAFPWPLVLWVRFYFTSKHNRFNELYNRYAALVAPNGTLDQRSARGSTAAGPSASSSAGSISSGQSSAQSVRRQAGGSTRKEVEGEPGAGTGSQSSAVPDRLNLETAETLSGAHRRFVSAVLRGATLRTFALRWVPFSVLMHWL